MKGVLAVWALAVDACTLESSRGLYYPKLSWMIFLTTTYPVSRCGSCRPTVFAPYRITSGVWNAQGSGRCRVRSDALPYADPCSVSRLLAEGLQAVGLRARGSSCREKPTTWRSS